MKKRVRHRWAVRFAIVCVAPAGVFAVSGCASPKITADLAYFPAKPATPHVVHLKSFNALDELVAPPSSWTDVFSGRPIGAFVTSPGGIAVRGDHLYVCDLGANVVHDWDLAAAKARRLGSGMLRKPIDVAVDAGGTVYLADTGKSAVIALRADGSHQPIKPDREAYRPVAVAVHGDALYVADVASHQLDVFGTADGLLRETIGGVGTEPGKMYFPAGVATDRNGRLFASDMMNSRVQAFDAAYKPTLAFGQPGDRYGDMGKPRHLAVGPDEVIFVADAEFGCVHLFDDQGRLLMLLGCDGSGPGRTPMPAGVAVAESLPPAIAALVPEDFAVHYYLFVTNSTGDKRISLYAVGVGR